MSISIDWSKLVEDKTLETKLKDFLDDQFRNLHLPSFIQSLRVESLKLGEVGPEVTIRHISDPFREFYDDAAEEDEFSVERIAAMGIHRDAFSHSTPNHSIGDTTITADTISAKSASDERETSTLDETNHDGQPHSTPHSGRHSMHTMQDDDDEHPHDDETHDSEHSDDSNAETPPTPSPFDFQTIVELQYGGDMELGVTATLLVNYPSPNFISLPLSFKVSGIDIHSLAVVAVIGQRVSISVLCDVDSNDQMSSESVKVIRTMKIQSKIGDSAETGSVLYNVGRVEEFILVQLRKVIRDELVWPGWITLEF